MIIAPLDDAEIVREVRRIEPEQDVADDNDVEVDNCSSFLALESIKYIRNFLAKNGYSKWENYN